jgi:hypothetical protein
MQQAPPFSGPDHADSGDPNTVSIEGTRQHIAELIGRLIARRWVDSRQAEPHTARQLKTPPT